MARVASPLWHPMQTDLVHSSAVAVRLAPVVRVFVAAMEKPLAVSLLNKF